MKTYTGGKTDVVISFGFASLNFSNGYFNFFGKKGNSILENIGYGLGALANVNDLLAGFNKSNLGDVDLVTENSDAIGHSAIIEPGSMDNNNSIVSFGPPDRDMSLKPFNSVRGENTWVNHVNDGSTYWRTNISGVNVNKVIEYGQNLTNNSPKYNLYTSSCVTHTSSALIRSGFINIGIHPYLLHGQTYLRSIGLRTYFSHFLQ